MDRHSKDNDKKPRPRQGGGAFADRKPGGKYDRDKPRSDKPRGDKPGSDRGRDDKAGGKPAPKRTERIAKALARAGIASRREVERLIGLGQVAVNGKILDTPATLVTRDDVITVKGKPVGAAEATRVWRYHKPAGLVTSHMDPAGRPTVFDALPSGLPRVISVGRLDLNTEGLLLLTNDGELSRALELPTSALVRQYRARARGRITQEKLDTLKIGTTVDGIHYGPIEATIDKVKDKVGDDGHAPANLWLSVSITEGKNREVRRPYPPREPAAGQYGVDPRPQPRTAPARPCGGRQVGLGPVGPLAQAQPGAGRRCRYDRGRRAGRDRTSGAEEGGLGQGRAAHQPSQTRLQAARRGSGRREC